MVEKNKKEKRKFEMEINKQPPKKNEFIGVGSGTNGRSYSIMPIDDVQWSDVFFQLRYVGGWRNLQKKKLWQGIARE